jgi:hypothetical protein
MHDLARLYLIQHKYSQARPLLERLVAIREKALGANDPALLSPLRALAELYIAERRYTAAEPLYMHLFSIQQKAFGQEHSAYAADLERYAFVLRKPKRKKEAAVAGRSCFSNFLGDGRSSRLSVANLPRPEQAEAFAVSADHGLRFDDDEGTKQPIQNWDSRAQRNRSAAVSFGSLDRALQDAELVAQSKDLKLKSRSGPEQCQKGCRECCEHRGWRESTEAGQLSLYQPDRGFQ